MSPETITAIAAGIAVVIAAVATAITKVLPAWKAYRTRRALRHDAILGICTRLDALNATGIRQVQLLERIDAKTTRTLSEVVQSRAVGAE